MSEICDVCYSQSGQLRSSHLDDKMLCHDCVEREDLGIPRDEYSSGHSDNKCWAKIYGRTEEGARAKAKRYYGSYPVQGYSTHTHHCDWLDNLPGAKVRIFYIRISRWHSCD